MLKLLKNNSIVIFAIVGGLSTILNFAVFFVIHKLMNANYNIAYIIGYLSGVFLGFYLNKKWTFNYNGKSLPAGIKYFTVYGISLILGMGLLNIIVKYLHIDPVLAQVMIIVVTTISNYFGAKLIAFKK